MPEHIDPDDVLDLSIAELSGRRLSTQVSESKRVELQLSVGPVGEDLHFAQVTARVRTFVPEGQDDAQGAADALYEGSVAYIVRFADHGADDVELDAGQIVTFVWPYLRLGLIEHASRLGADAPQLPLKVSTSSLVEAEAGRHTS
ncbi:hypothetical protein AB6N24_09945 [Cellulomonas sp. 179-A 4D5 NHS]|uniref:hypothetical protein n=1 Tax=Cellulomonas sp. 179-A 4D5 NHS TaxID=3142378 RepID=UPI00399F2E00